MPPRKKKLAKASTVAKANTSAKTVVVQQHALKALPPHSPSVFDTFLKKMYFFSSSPTPTKTAHNDTGPSGNSTSSSNTPTKANNKRNNGSSDAATADDTQKQQQQQHVHSPLFKLPFSFPFFSSPEQQSKPRDVSEESISSTLSLGNTITSTKNSAGVGANAVHLASPLLLSPASRTLSNSGLGANSTGRLLSPLVILSPTRTPHVTTSSADAAADPDTDASSLSFERVEIDAAHIESLGAQLQSARAVLETLHDDVLDFAESLMDMATQACSLHNTSASALAVTGASGGVRGAGSAGVGAAVGGAGAVPASVYQEQW